MAEPARIGEPVGCSQMHVSRLIRVAITRLAAVGSAQTASDVRGTAAQAPRVPNTGWITVFDTCAAT